MTWVDKWTRNAALISFPRAGRTWLLRMVGLAIAHSVSRPDQDAEELRKLVLEASHDMTDKSRRVHKDDLCFRSSAWLGKDILFLTRDPRDQVVSAYIHATKHKRHRATRDMTLSDYIRDPCYGVEKIVRFNNIWAENRNLLRSFSLVWYEDLKKDTCITFTDCMAFFGYPVSFNDDITYAVEKLQSVEQMQEYERTNFFGDYHRPKNPEDYETYYSRRGIVGDYVNYMVDEDIAFCDKAMLEMRFWQIRQTM